MPSQSGDKRRWVVQRLNNLLRLPPDARQSSVGSGQNTDLPIDAPIATAEAPRPGSSIVEPTHNPTDIPGDEVIPPEKHMVATAPQPIAWLKTVDVDRFEEAVKNSYFAPEDECLGQITIFGEVQADRDQSADNVVSPSGEEIPADLESAIGSHHDGFIDDSESDDGEPTRSKGFSPLFDTGATVSIIPEKTLRRLKRGRSKTCYLHPEQQKQLQLVDYRGQKYKPVGLVPLLWSLDAFPAVIFNTTFWVVDGNVPNDLLIGRDVMIAVHAAIKVEKEFRNRGPIRKVRDVIRYRAVGMLRQPQ